MSYSIIWSPQANQDFLNILGFLIDNVNDVAAADLVLDVQKWIDTIADFPFICPLSKKGDAHKCVINKHYILIYSIVETEIHITYFFDARSNHPF
jgi:plasmid stabilization system protein ParE